MKFFLAETIISESQVEAIVVKMTQMTERSMPSDSDWDGDGTRMNQDEQMC